MLDRCSRKLEMTSLARYLVQAVQQNDIIKFTRGLLTHSKQSYFPYISYSTVIADITRHTIWHQLCYVNSCNLF